MKETKEITGQTTAGKTLQSHPLFSGAEIRMRGSNTGPKKEMETKYWSDCRARLTFIIYSIVRENGRERWGGE